MTIAPIHSTPPPLPSWDSDVLLEVLYLVKHAGKVQGPFPAHFIAGMIEADVYSPTISVQREGETSWVPFASLKLDLPGSDTAARTLQNSSQESEIPSASVINHKALAGVFIAVFLLSTWIAAQNPPAKNITAHAAQQATPSSSKPLEQTRDDRSPATSPSYASSDSSTSYSSYGTPSYTDKKTPDYVPPPAPSSPYKNSINVPLDGGFRPPTTTYRPKESSSYDPYGDTSSTSPLESSYENAPEQRSVAGADGRSYRVSDADYIELRLMRSAVEKKKEKVEAGRAELAAEDKKLTRAKRQVDRTDKREVTAYNKKVAELNAMQAELELLRDSFNEDVDAYNAKLVRVGTPIE